VQQICIFNGKEEFTAHLQEYEQSNNRQRIRYDVPTYIKFYSLYQYDRQKFRELLNIWLKTDEGKNRTIETLKAKQDEILKLCYNVDENGKPLKDSDEAHIWRYATMQRIYEAIYQTLIERGLVSVLTQGVYEYDRFIINAEEMQAEVKGTALKSLNERLRIHIKALRELRNDKVAN
jgi:hypothetical protein